MDAAIRIPAPRDELRGQCLIILFIKLSCTGPPLIGLYQDYPLKFLRFG
jgi:hypothetical protein